MRSARQEISRTPGVIPVVQNNPSPTDHGLVGWSFDPALAQAGTLVPAAGVLNLARVRVLGSAVTAIQVYVTAGGATLTASQCLAAVFNDAGALLGAGAVTADQSTAWASTGLKDMALTVAQAVTPGAFYQIGLFYNGTTAPTLARASTVAAALNNAGMGSAPYRFSTANTGLTTAMPGSLGAQTAAANAWWVGVR